MATFAPARRLLLQNQSLEDLRRGKFSLSEDKRPPEVRKNWEALMHSHAHPPEPVRKQVTMYPIAGMAAFLVLAGAWAVFEAVIWFLG